MVCIADAPVMRNITYDSQMPSEWSRGSPQCAYGERLNHSFSLSQSLGRLLKDIKHGKLVIKKSGPTKKPGKQIPDQPDGKPMQLMNCYSDTTSVTLKDRSFQRHTVITFFRES